MHKFTFLAVAFILLGLMVAPSMTQDRWYNFPYQAAMGAYDMYNAYSNMREANWKNSDQYFHARGNYDAAQRGAGGRWAARVISNGRESYQSGLSGQGAADTRRDQEANEWGRSGGDPNRYRPAGLPDRY